MYVAKSCAIRTPHCVMRTTRHVAAVDLSSCTQRLLLACTANVFPFHCARYFVISMRFAACYRHQASTQLFNAVHRPLVVRSCQAKLMRYRSTATWRAKFPLTQEKINTMSCVMQRVIENVIDFFTRTPFSIRTTCFYESIAIFHSSTLVTHSSIHSKLYHYFVQFRSFTLFANDHKHFTLL